MLTRCLDKGHHSRIPINASALKYHKRFLVLNSKFSVLHIDLITPENTIILSIYLLHL